MHAVFDATKAYRRVAFYGGFKFAPEGTHGHLVAEAQNFGLPSSQLTQAWRLYVRKAEDVPGKRPGSRCDVPA
jgi:hypothetical protein